MLLPKLHPNERWDLLLHKELDKDAKLHASVFFRTFRHQERKSDSTDISDKVPFWFCGVKISAGVKTWVVRPSYYVFLYEQVHVL